MNAAISSKTFPATTHAGRINFNSSSDFNLIPATNSKAPAHAAFFQEAVVVAHRVEQNADGDQNARAAEKTGHGVGDVQLLRKDDRNRCNDGQENRSRQRD